ncbi:MAG: hypothetical protein JWP44_4474, partial [Mucilaginibacter sp.]|nr:hypothetical protein [Mucilaginibacter sp.]
IRPPPGVVFVTPFADIVRVPVTTTSCTDDVAVGSTGSARAGAATTASVRHVVLHNSRRRQERKDISGPPSTSSRFANWKDARGILR